MEKERSKPWPHAAEKVIKQLNTSTKNGYEVAVELNNLSDLGEERIGIAGVYKNIEFLATSGLIDFVRKPVMLGNEAKYMRHWRLTDKGAQVAFERGLITDTDQLRIILQREQDPGLNKK